MVAEVIINTIAKELNKTYDYIIPDSILNQIKIGSRVFVPFGRAKQKEGFERRRKQPAAHRMRLPPQAGENLRSERRRKARRTIRS